MTLTGIISVAGLPGLHKILTQTKNGFIVESLVDGKRRPIYASQRVSALEDISIFTSKEDIPLKDVFKKIYDQEGGKKSMDHKSDPARLREFLTGLIKDLDNDRVYNSDIAKLFQWYNLLLEKKLLGPEKKGKKTEGGKTPKVEKPVKKTATKRKTSAIEKKPVKKGPASSPAKSKATAVPRKSSRKS